MPSRKQAPSGMYSAQQAIAKLNIPSATFYDLVEAGTFQRVRRGRGREGFYVQSQIDNYARDWKARTDPYSADRLDFGLALNEDLVNIHNLVASVSGGQAHAVPAEVIKAWIRREPQSVHVLRRGSEIEGYISMFLLEPDTLQQRLDGRLLNRRIPIDDIVPFSPGTSYPLYIAEMAVRHRTEFIKNDEPDPDKVDPVARKLGQRLLRNATDFIFDLIKNQNAKISELYAVGTSPYGLAMCENLGMEPMDYLESGVREDRVPFKLDLSQPDIKSSIVRRIVAA